MGQKEFELLLDNMDKIKVAVEGFPEDCRKMVYSSLLATLQNDNTISTEDTTVADITGDVEVSLQNSDERNIAEELEQYYWLFSLDKASDMEFAAFLAYFFARLAPPDELTERIDESHYKMACMITERNVPGRISGTLNNAKNLKGFLESHGSGVYSISAVGEHYVKHRLMRENEE